MFEKIIPFFKTNYWVVGRRKGDFKNFSMCCAFPGNPVQSWEDPIRRLAWPVFNACMILPIASPLARRKNSEKFNFILMAGWLESCKISLRLIYIYICSSQMEYLLYLEGKYTKTSGACCDFLQILRLCQPKFWLVFLCRKITFWLTLFYSEIFFSIFFTSKKSMLILE